MCQSIILALLATKHSKSGKNLKDKIHSSDLIRLLDTGELNGRACSCNCSYLINDTYWDKKDDSPIFFYTGNEGNIELFAQNTGFMWEIAEEFRATLGISVNPFSLQQSCVTVGFFFFVAFVAFVEHRYYGKSLPFDNKSFTAPEYSGYLTSEQALADFASILVNQLNKDNRRPVITFGGSYGGMLSAWFRMKYPHLITGAIAASAPIFQFTTDCNAFNMILSSVFTAGQGNCSRNIFRTWDLIKWVV